MTDLLSRVATALSGRYRIECELGRGGMATVFLADDLRHGRQVAVKVVEPDLASTLTSDRFLREIEVAARLTHPHILALHDSGEADGLLYYVMPYIEGETLRGRLQREGPLPTEDALRIVREVAGALDYAHRAGIVHRDIKPENLLFASGHALVSDFGIARVAAAAGSERLTATGLSIGTPAYMSPEQSAGTGSLDARSDIYSLACVAYEMLGGAPPFTGPNAQAVMARHAMDAVPSLRTLRPTLTEDIDRVLAKALAKVPADRYPTASQFADALERAHLRFATFRFPARAVSLAGLRSRPIIIALAGAVTALLLAMPSARTWLGKASGSRPASVGVVPFDNLSGDSAQQYLVEGVQNTLVGALGQVGALRVIWTQGRGARERLMQRGLTQAELARELNADGIVTASVLRAGDSVQVQARLFHADGQLAWSDEFSSDVRGMLALCSEIAHAIARATRTDVNAAAVTRMAALPQFDSAVYESYLRGMYYLERQTPDDTRRGIQHLEDAIRRDPANPYAYAALAEGYATAGHSPASPPDAWQRARAAAERALALRPDLADAHAVLARVKMYYENDWAGAERAFQRTFNLNPSHAFAHYHYSWFLTLFDRFDDAIAEHKMAQELDPLTPVTTTHLGTTYLWANRPDDALAEVAKVLERDSLNGVALAIQSYAYAIKGDFERAIAIGEKSAAVIPPWRIFLGLTYARARRPDDTRRLISELESQPTTAYRNLMLAFFHGVLGNHDEAFRLLEQEPAHAWRPWVRNWPGLEGLRQDPRFPALMRRFNLPT
ncbi:MAG: protein kinase [Gemmatimonadetes bacterium]|nr:protein kinase [Gemmatimonadota bacterium]